MAKRTLPPDPATRAIAELKALPPPTADEIRLHALFRGRIRPSTAGSSKPVHEYLARGAEQRALGVLARLIRTNTLSVKDRILLANALDPDVAPHAYMPRKLLF
jgi:hypothetical protein